MNSTTAGLSASTHAVTSQDLLTRAADENIEAIRRHAHAMAHTLIEVFLHQPNEGRR